MIEAKIYREKRMNEKEMLQERTRIVEEIVTRAWSDASFKKQLLENPTKAVEAIYGLKLPESIKVKVIEETEDTRYVVIPYRPPVCDELSNEDLEAVAGGISCVTDPPSNSTRSKLINSSISITSNPINISSTPLSSISAPDSATQMC